MRDERRRSDHGTRQMAVTVTARFEQSGKIYPEIVSWHGQAVQITKIRKVSYFCGDDYWTPNRVFLVEYNSGTFHLFYIDQRWFVNAPKQ